MQFRSVVALVVLGAVCVAASNVIDLSTHKDAATFDSNTEEPMLVEFFAPWCGHCKKLAPIWEDLANSPPEGVKVAKVDATVNKDMASRFGVRGYPTIKFLKEGKVYDYKGARTLDAFKKFAEGGYSSATSKSRSEL